MAEIVGYDFGKYVKCPGCVGWLVAGSTDSFGRDREPLNLDQVEALLDQRAKAAGIDRRDESTFDQHKDFPKRVLRGQDCQRHQCYACGLVL